MTKQTIEEAAKKHALKMWGDYIDETHKDLFTETLGDITIKDFTDGAKSDAAKDYWYAKFQQERMFKIMDSYTIDVIGGCNLKAEEWFEQFKKK